MKCWGGGAILRGGDIQRGDAGLKDGLVGEYLGDVGLIEGYDKAKSARKMAR